MALPTYDAKRTNMSMFDALLKARADYGKSKEILWDGNDDRKLTYDEIVRAAFALGHALKRFTAKGETVGVMLPSSAGAVIAFFALHAFGRIPAMLNFTAGERALSAAVKLGGIKTILSAKRFIELGKFEDLVEALKTETKIVYLDDVREELTLSDKLTALFGSMMPGLFKARQKATDTGVILFTSGTEGDPKGVVLSHQNILANIEQVRCHIELYQDDIVFNPLPTFHCFGLTVGALLPMMVGVKEILYPSPLHVQIIPKKIRESGATILLATDTFIGHYARQGDQGDLNTVRLAVCGAERVRDETRQLVRKKYNIEILEGYGVTEAAPVIAANQIEANKPGTVGRMLPMMESRLEPVEGIPNAGRLFVKGPNVMAGYLTPGKPGVLQTLPGGWHDTGDVVSIDNKGHIAIKGRVRRFAKIGGEMVSLTVVENCATALWPDNMHAAVSIPDDRKGEQIVLVTDSKEANRSDLHSWAHNHGVPELAVPRKIILVDEVPLLGTGKTNYVAVQKMVDAQIAPKAA
ncbi:Bifunctional protein Aas [Alphaproteobacteria bacterium SO-S41]|nr:Bifunctional protein Aas [Alphaproteobacteria bacterium SO-S41]